MEAAFYLYAGGKPAVDSVKSVLKGNFFYDMIGLSDRAIRNYWRMTYRLYCFHFYYFKMRVHLGIGGSNAATFLFYALFRNKKVIEYLNKR